MRPRTAPGPGRTASGRPVGPARSRPSCSRFHWPPSLVTREEDQPLDQPPATRRCKGYSNQGHKKSAEPEARGCGTEGCKIGVRDMPRDQRVQKSELWAAGAGFANRCERAGEGYFLIQGAACSGASRGCAIPAANLLFTAANLFGGPMSGIAGIARAIPAIPHTSLSRNSSNSELNRIPGAIPPTYPRV